jgi:hypothetical protein
MKTLQISEQPTMPVFNFYNDRVPVEILPAAQRPKMYEQGLVSNEGRHLISFCGMQSTPSGINIFLPRSCDAERHNHSDQIKIASQLMQAIERYGRETSTTVDQMDEGDGRKGLEQLSLIKSLLIDYRENGLYTKRQTLPSKNSGKPDWKRTIAQSISYVDLGNQPVFLEVISTKRRYFSDSEVSRIHASVIRQLEAKYVWLLGEVLFPFFYDLKGIPKPRGDNLYQLAILRRELSLTYSERDILLLNQLIKILEQDSGELYSGFVVGLQRFHHAWEYMLKQTLEHTVELNRWLPAPVYIYQNGSRKSAFERGMRVDIFLMPPKLNRLTIIDAKYYAAETVANSPGWSDLVKQFFYAKALQTIFPEHVIKNAFVFPGHSGVFKEVKMESRVQKAKSDSIEIQFPPIDCYYINPLWVIERFVKGTTITECQLRSCENRNDL